MITDTPTAARELVQGLRAVLGPAVDADKDDWRRMLDINVSALLYCAHAAIPHLLAAAQEGPRNVADMVNIS